MFDQRNTPGFVEFRRPLVQILKEFDSRGQLQLNKVTRSRSQTHFVQSEKEDMFECVIVTQVNY